MKSKYDLTENTVYNFRRWFISYINSFPSSDTTMHYSFTLKKEHSLRVCTEILNLGNLLGLDIEGLLLAETAALFHDIGRFEQYYRYKTFFDGNSEDHANLGIMVLREKGIMNVLERSTRDLILKTISYHNRLSIPEGESDTCLFFSRLLRDADKLDILRLVTSYYRDNNPGRSAAIELDLPDNSDISEEVVENLKEGHLVSSKQLRTLNDFKLLQMGWVYDINFQPTFQMIHERGYLKAIRESLPPSNDIDEVFSLLSAYLERHVSNITGTNNS